MQEMKKEYELILATTSKYGRALYESNFNSCISYCKERTEMSLHEIWDNLVPIDIRLFSSRDIPEMTKKASENMALYEKKKVRLTIKLEISE